MRSPELWISSLQTVLSSPRDFDYNSHTFYSVIDQKESNNYRPFGRYENYDIMGGVIKDITSNVVGGSTQPT